MELKDNVTVTSSAVIAPTSIKTLFEPNEINILPRHRLKVRQTDLIPALCFYNGSFVPIHAGHISVLEEAKRYIDNLGTHELLGAYISPSHSGYIAKKLKSDEIIGVGHRLSMIYLAIEHLDWVMVDLYETFQPCNTGLDIIVEAFVSRVHCQFSNGKQMDVFWLKGEDALSYSFSWDRPYLLGYHSVYIINRGCDINLINNDNESKSVQDYYNEQWEYARGLSSFPERFHIIHTTHMNLSSSKIRACARDPYITREQLQLSTQLDSITTYILQHQLWKTLVDEVSTTVPVLSEFHNQMDDVTPEVLSYMFSAYSNSLVKVISFGSKRIGIGTGLGGNIYRLYNIKYSPDSGNCMPGSVVLKLSNGFWHELVASIEPEFYLRLGPRISNITIPKCYYVARYSDSSIESLLLLEDLSIDYDPLDLTDSLKDSTLLSAIASIASLHAEFFKHPLLHQEAFAWLPSLNSTFTYYYDQYALQMANNKFTSFLKSKLTDKAYAYANALLIHLPHVFQRLSDENYTLAHGDFWINNILARYDQPSKMILFDWRTCCRANGLIDVVFLLRLLDKDQARSLEPQALEVYHQTLVKYGVLKYGISNIREDYYSLALPFMFVMCLTWKYLSDEKLTQVTMILEDIITHSKETKGTICDCKLDLQ